MAHFEGGATFFSCHSELIKENRLWELGENWPQSTGEDGLVVEASTAPEDRWEQASGSHAPPSDAVRIHCCLTGRPGWGGLHQDGKGILVCKGPVWKMFKLLKRMGQCWEVLHSVEFCPRL